MGNGAGIGHEFFKGWIKELLAIKGVGKAVLGDGLDESMVIRQLVGINAPRTAS